MLAFANSEVGTPSLAEIGIDDLCSEGSSPSIARTSPPPSGTSTRKFEEYDLTGNIAYSCDDTYSLVSLVSAGLGIGFAPEWTEGLPNRAFELTRCGLSRHLRRQNPVAIMREHCRMPHPIIDPRTHEPAEQ